MKRHVPSAIAIMVGLTVAQPAAADLTNAQKCEISYIKATGKRLQCILKACEKGIKVAGTPDFDKCETKFHAAIIKVEGKLGADCPARSWMGATTRHVDNGDGTLSDRASTLTWELKLGDGGSRDVDNTHPWAGSCSGGAGFCQPTADAAALCPTNSDGVPELGCQVCPGGQTCNVTDGQGTNQTVFSYVDSLNDSNFGGYNDWRVPTRGELSTILAEPAFCTVGPPCITDEFHQGPASFTASAGYWASTVEPAIPQVAYNISFFSGSVVSAVKSAPQRIRAVRGP